MPTDFTKLRVYVLASELAEDIKSLVRTFPQDERFELASQLSRAGTSIPTNIAEGCGRKTLNDFSNFIDIAIGSSKEVESLLLSAKNRGYINQYKYNELQDKADHIGGMLTALKQGRARKVEEFKAQRKEIK